MLAADVTGVISSIITIIDTSIKIYRAAVNASDLPQSFGDAAARLPLVQDTLRLATGGLNEDALDAESHATLTLALEKCTNRAAVLLDIFQIVIPSERASRRERYLRALKTIPQAEKVESLMSGILVDLQLLATNHAVRAATRQQMERLMSKIMIQDQPARRPPIILNNSGSGRQYVHCGTGDQNVVSGTATQINGPFSGGTWNFYER
ncbi:uncharacterized protein NECHADRAFT_78331 [Fusarium vanettenii 77-13-4]|uniref:NACHT-NTPase and P-loop NTPases N-terminal domain-containing protein n=1 Tax=Fusarium vanettenii (strain ATCC MYA-4622 / CBS 123669 / FGSC 9596 / NRRL 45880 / 77-13-4) TaxID=660122 RepID=C7ZFI0_FUSV7|nr:uncharacterized protein NECHADRAFT_78331 [Fusarium vanettenii 77-13-4]EEU37247.1 hypothetical protein NECHADRAFT_78331 [Fusarium vanettenii 77-13-4]